MLYILYSAVIITDIYGGGGGGVAIFVFIYRCWKVYNSKNIFVYQNDCCVANIIYSNEFGPLFTRSTDREVMVIK